MAGIVSQPPADSSPRIGSLSNPQTPGPRARPPWDPHDPTNAPEALPSPNGDFRDRYFRDLPPTGLLGSLIQPSHKNASGSGGFSSNIASPKQGRSEAESPICHHSAPPKRQA
ncbi:hypothetical protein IFR05_017077 [Cadophora sp. M221]|nr:hypothetical protein IFR05_017077 [Cadophora sp. M221]